MPADARKEIARQREQDIWALRQKLWTQDRIAAHLGITQGAVSHAIRRITVRMLKGLDAQVKQTVIEQVVQLSYVADEAMQAWQRSKETAKSVSQKKAIGGRADSLEETVTRVQDQDGDPRYLSTALSAMADIRKILGADAPARQELTGKDGGPIQQETKIEYANLTDAELNARITDKLALAAKITEGGSGQAVRRAVPPSPTAFVADHPGSDPGAPDDA